MGFSSDDLDWLFGQRYVLHPCSTGDSLLCGGRKLPGFSALLPPPITQTNPSGPMRLPSKSVPAPVVKLAWHLPCESAVARSRRWPVGRRDAAPSSLCSTPLTEKTVPSTTTHVRGQVFYQAAPPTHRFPTETHALRPLILEVGTLIPPNRTQLEYARFSAFH